MHINEYSSTRKGVDTMATYYQIGSKGNEVKTLQDQLRAAGYDPGISDGIYGKNTTSAVTEYQKAKGLTVDGIAGVQTLGSLNTPIIPSQQPQPVQTVQPVQPAAKQPAQPEPVYTSPYAKQEQQALPRIRSGHHSLMFRSMRHSLKQRLTKYCPVPSTMTLPMMHRHSLLKGTD